MDMDKAYDPRKVEPGVYERWLALKAFAADPAAAGARYCIVIPPPNVTAALHLGHALNNTLQDILVRWKRMQGCNALWMPGTDHAGIATQTVVEKRILSEEGKRRTDFARDQFVARVQAWKDEYEATIIGQLKAMGCSCDWDRTRFTMDETCAKAVRAAFFKLFADGLIYRGKRLVNWDVATQTVLADDEVEYETVQGNFWYLRYPVVDGTTGVSPVAMLHAIRMGGTPVLPGFVTVATTRPETMLGDTAVAMNPRDPRAKDLVGKMVRLPIVARLIPIIADEHVALPNPDSDDAKARFSTGFLKVTPAHDPDDYAIGQRHNLPVINVLAPDGTISAEHGWDDWEQIKNPDVEALIGLDRFEARAAVVEWFRTEGLLEDVKPYAHEVGHSYRSLVPIEPYLSDQWFIAVRKPIPGPGTRDQGPGRETEPGTRNPEPDPEVIPGTDVPANSLAGLALKPLLDGKLRFVPERYANNYRSWLENLRDWPISRQLWWGHRIPVWWFQPSSGGTNPSFPLAHRDPEGYQREFEKRLDDYLMRSHAGCKFAVRIDVGSGTCRICPAVPSADQALRALIPPVAQAYVPGQPLTVNGPGVKPAPEALGAANKLREMIDTLTRDPDVLDTWFSSALWPISTMGWPEETELLKKFYPTDVLCTAREIITLWVSRMVMFGQYFRGDVPFHEVYIHAMIQDGEGRKMSKSLGNGIDPLDIIESHGADAMRFTLAYMSTETQDVRMPVAEMTLPDGRKANTSPKFDLGRNFCNKLWNAARFALMNLEGTPAWGAVRPSAGGSDRWILSRLSATIRDVTESLEAYRFHEAAGALYRYMWNDFCDWYLEIAKVRLAGGDSAPKAVLAHALDVLLRLLHPLCPFITEEIWAQLGKVVGVRGPGDTPAEPLLVKAAWPKAQSDCIDPLVEKQFEALQTLISGIRDVRTRNNITAGRKLAVTIAAEGEDARGISDNAELIRALAGVETLKLEPTAQPGGNDATVLAANLRALVHDVVDRAAELAKLAKRRETLVKGIASAEGKLANDKFVANAPADVVARERQRLSAMKDELSAVDKSVATLK